MLRYGEGEYQLRAHNKHLGHLRAWRRWAGIRRARELGVLWGLVITACSDGAHRTGRPPASASRSSIRDQITVRGNNWRVWGVLATLRRHNRSLAGVKGGGAERTGRKATGGRDTARRTVRASDPDDPPGLDEPGADASSTFPAQPDPTLPAEVSSGTEGSWVGGGSSPGP